MSMTHDRLAGVELAGETPMKAGGAVQAGVLVYVLSMTVSAVVAEVACAFG